MCGLSTSGGRQVELNARAFAAIELKLDIIQSKPNESQSNLLRVKELGIPDPKTVRENAVDDVTKWPQVSYTRCS